MWNYSTSNPREHPTRRESNSVSTTPTTSEDSNPPFIHFIFLASILTPVALLPYLLTRRRLSTLNNTISELRSSNVRLQKEVKVAVRESIKHRIQVETLTEKTHVSLGRLILEMRKREVGRLIAEESMRKDLKELVLEKREMRWVPQQRRKGNFTSLIPFFFLPRSENSIVTIPSSCVYPIVQQDASRNTERPGYVACGYCGFHAGGWDQAWFCSKEGWWARDREDPTDGPEIAEDNERRRGQYRLSYIDSLSSHSFQTPILSEEMKTGEPEGNASVKEQETQTDSKSSDKTWLLGHWDLWYKGIHCMWCSWNKILRCKCITSTIPYVILASTTSI